MNTRTRFTILAAVFSAFAATMQTSPASAMGRSGAPSQRPAAEPKDRLGRMETRQTAQVADLQSQVDALRKELAALKAQLEVGQGVASSN